MIQVTDDDRSLYAALTNGFENEGGYQSRQVGRDALTYISGEQCVTRLNNTFGPLGWTFEVRERWFDETADECLVLGRLTVFRKIQVMESQTDADGEISYPIREVIQPIYHEQVGSQKHNRRKVVIITQEAFDRLSLPDYSPPKQYLYTQLPDGNWRKNDSNEILDAGFDWKGAGTDSLKKCASLFGIALELSKRGASRPQQQPARAPQRPQNRPNQPARPQSQGAQDKPAPAKPAAGAKPNLAGFTPPFKSQKVTHQLACRAEGCSVVMEPETEYEAEIGGKIEKQMTEYIVKRAKEEAGTVFCIEHVIEWIMAKKAQGIPLASDPSHHGAAA